jgi:site-specific DNA recombinase
MAVKRSSTPQVRRVAVYARLSVTTEESVSIARQLDAGRKLAAARGWTVVLVAKDDGVSATKNRPEDRAGWREILDSPETFEAVIVWKVDRLARRVLDFLHADEALQQRGAGLVAVEDPIDMTTAQGRAFATMLAVFGELEAAAISARVTAARRAIVHSGRRAGGRPPFGWMNVENPSGPGMILAKDPGRIGVVEDLARRALAGESLYSLTRWLEAQGVAPRERGKRKDANRWHEASVEAILRNPALAGLTPYRGDVIRDADGLPVVDGSVAILSTAERRQLLTVLDERKAPRTRPYSSGGLLSGLIRCDSCGGPMYRATAAGKYLQYRCQQRGCPRPIGVSRPAVESVVVDRFLSAFGRFPVIQIEAVEPVDPAPRLVEIEAAITDTTLAMQEDDADVPALLERLATLKGLRARARTEAHAAPEVREVVTGETFSEAWHATEDELARRELLACAIEEIVVLAGGGRGRALDPERVVIRYRDAGVSREDLDGSSPGPARGRAV